MARENFCASQSERDKPGLSRGHYEPAMQDPYWMVVILKKTPLIEAEGRLRFAAEAVLLPHVLLLAANFSLAEEAPRTSKPSQPKPQNVTPRSKLVQSYHQDIEHQRPQTSGPPWLVNQIQSNETRNVLYTPAWEQKHRPLEGANFSLVKCNKVHQDRALCPKGEVFGRARSANGEPSRAEADNRGAFARDETASSSFAKGGDEAKIAHVPGPLCEQKEVSRKGATLKPYLPRRVIGAAAAARQKRDTLRKHTKDEITDSEPRTNCTVYRQRVGMVEEVEPGARMGGLLVENATDSKARIKKEVVGQQVVLAFSGEAAKDAELVYEGGWYLVPAPKPSLPLAPTTDSPARAPSFVPHASLPVIQLRTREAVHRFTPLSSGLTNGSKAVQGSQGLLIEKDSKSSFMLELPDSIHQDLVAFLNLSLSKRQAEKNVRRTRMPQTGAELIRLRGRVTDVLRLQLVWGCPNCGSQPQRNSDVRELPPGASSAVRCGCIYCCLDESFCTVLLREACFAFDDGFSRHEVWANGESAAELLGLPYTSAELSTTNPPVKETPNRLHVEAHCNIAAATHLSQRSEDDGQLSIVDGPLTQDSSMLQQITDQTDCSKDRAASTTVSANPSETFSRAFSHQHQQQAAAACMPHGVKRLHSTLDSVMSAREQLLDNVNKQPKLGRRHEPDILWRNLQRCILDLPKSGALVRKESSVEVKTNPGGAAAGSFQASKRDMIGYRTGQLTGSNREALEVLLNEACCHGQKVLSCVPLEESAYMPACFQRSEKCSSTGANRCRVYLSGQVFEIYAPNISRYRALKTEPVSFSSEAAILSRALSEMAS